MYSLHQKRLNFNHFYKLPDAAQGLESLERLLNFDLPEMDTFSLKQEAYRIRAALAYLDLERQPWLFLECGKYVAASDWLKKRQTAIQKELNRRGGRKHEHKKQA